MTEGLHTPSLTRSKKQSAKIGAFRGMSYELGLRTIASWANRAGKGQ